jgi:hypothetical protein
MILLYVQYFEKKISDHPGPYTEWFLCCYLLRSLHSCHVGIDVGKEFRKINMEFWNHNGFMKMSQMIKNY